MSHADDRMKEARAATESIRRRQEREGADEQIQRIRDLKAGAENWVKQERPVQRDGAYYEVYESEEPRAGRDVPEFGGRDSAYSEFLNIEQDASLELDGPPTIPVETQRLDLPFDGTVDFTGFLEGGLTPKEITVEFVDGPIVSAFNLGPEVVGLPKTSEARKNTPMATGLLDYFPDALAEVARVSKAGNDKHNPGEPLHWARGKSMDHADCIIRHLAERGARDLEGVRHSASVAWRALALLQEELEAEGAPLPRGARVATCGPLCGDTICLPECEGRSCRARDLEGVRHAQGAGSSLADFECECERCGPAESCRDTFFDNSYDPSDSC